MGGRNRGVGSPRAEALELAGGKGRMGSIYEKPPSRMEARAGAGSVWIRGRRERGAGGCDGDLGVGAGVQNGQ